MKNNNSLASSPNQTRGWLKIASIMSILMVVGLVLLSSSTNEGSARGKMLARYFRLSGDTEAGSGLQCRKRLQARVNSLTTVGSLRKQMQKLKARGIVKGVKEEHYGVILKMIHREHKVATQGSKLVFLFPSNMVATADVGTCEVTGLYMSDANGNYHRDVKADAVQGSKVAVDSRPRPPPTRRPTPRPTTPEPTPGRTTAGPACPYPRVRKDWRDLTQPERDLYISGFLKLRADGKLKVLTDEHVEAFQDGLDLRRFHSNSAFLPWHRYFVWELERQIRLQDDAHACFAMPYWDWTRQNGQTVSSNEMLSDGEGIGGNGNPNCVEDGRFSRSSGYTVTADGTSCLTRRFQSGTTWYQSTAETLEFVERVQSYVNFRSRLEGWHNSAHTSISGVLGTMRSTDDPIFWLLHTYVDTVWALRSTCHGYAGSGDSNNEYPTGELRDEMNYPILKDASWAYVNSQTVRVEDLLTTSDWDYKYDFSDMVSRSEMTMSQCSGNVGQQQAVAASVVVSGDSWKQDKATARRACQKQHGKHKCVYTKKFVPCDKKRPMTLKYITSRPYLDKCLVKHRTKMFVFAKRNHFLLDLCNGYGDPVCNFI